MATTLKYLPGSITTLLSTGLNSQANNALVLSSAYDNSSDLYPMAEIEFVTGAAFGTAPTVGTGMSVWFLRAPDGTNYEDGGTGLTPARPPDTVIPLENQNSTAQRVVRRCRIPLGTFKVLIKNDGTGQSLPSSGNTLKLLPFTLQQV